MWYEKETVTYLFNNVWCWSHVDIIFWIYSSSVKYIVKIRFLCFVFFLLFLLLSFVSFLLFGNGATRKLKCTSGLYLWLDCISIGWRHIKGHHPPSLISLFSLLLRLPIPFSRLMLLSSLVGWSWLVGLLVMGQLSHLPETPQSCPCNSSLLPPVDARSSCTLSRRFQL